MGISFNQIQIPFFFVRLVLFYGFAVKQFFSNFAFLSSKKK